MVTHEKTSVRGASASQNVSLTTLHRHIKVAKNNFLKLPVGRPPVLTGGEEDMAIELVNKYAAMGIPMNRSQILENYGWMCTDILQSIGVNS